MLILFHFMYILLNLENIVFFFSPSLFKCCIETLNICGTVIKTQCFIFLGVLWYRGMSPFTIRGKFFLFSVLQYMDSYVFSKTGFFLS